MCVRVCVRETERESESGRQRVSHHTCACYSRVRVVLGASCSVCIHPIERECGEEGREESGGLAGGGDGTGLARAGS